MTEALTAALTLLKGVANAMHLLSARTHAFPSFLFWSLPWLG